MEFVNNVIESECVLLRVLVTFKEHNLRHTLGSDCFSKLVVFIIIYCNLLYNLTTCVCMCVCVFICMCMTNKMCMYSEQIVIECVCVSCCQATAIHVHPKEELSGSCEL